ncbi:MAG: hypothetical protein UIH99_01570, partial [Alphaproteobacteria bacterium]|nr:hypothetical protein [Alphaproteobacteria bacterium]
MEISQFLIVAGAVISGMLCISLIVLFFVSRKSQKTMQSLLTIITQPQRAKIEDAVRVLETILADEINKIEQSFQTMRNTLDAQIQSANELNSALTIQNEQLVNNANNAT